MSVTHVNLRVPTLFLRCPDPCLPLSRTGTSDTRGVRTFWGTPGPVLVPLFSFPVKPL